MKGLLLRQSKNSEYVQQMTEMVNSFKKTFKYLDDIRRGHLYIGAPIKNLDELKSARERASKREPEDACVLAVCDSISAAPQAQNHLETIIETIEANLKSIELKQGRQPADHHKFVKTIADIFSEYLGNPSSTKRRSILLCNKNSLFSIGYAARIPG